MTQEVYVLDNHFVSNEYAVNRIYRQVFREQSSHEYSVCFRNIRQSTCNYSRTSRNNHLSLQRPFVFVQVDVPHIHSHFNLSVTATSPQKQQPLKRVLTFRQRSINQRWFI